MAKTHSKPGPKPKHEGSRIDLHARLSSETYAIIRQMADELDEHGKPIGVSDALEKYIRQHSNLSPQA